MMNTNFFYNAFIILAIAGILSSCSDDSYKIVEENTPTSGTLNVYCDLGMQEQMSAQAYTFERIYERAKINLFYCNEKEAVKALYDDSCKAIALNRPLSSDEEEMFKAKNIFISSSMIGKNAVALIINPEAADSVLSKEAFAALLAGDTSGTFKNIIFESEKAGTAIYCKDSLLKGASLGKNCYALKNINELIERISNDKKAIGVMDYIWISDRDDSLYKSLNGKIKILAVSANGNKTAYYPDQSNIQTSDYPLTRWMYMYRRGQDFSLAAGFITYVAGPDGQIFMLKSGLAPWRQPERVISVDMKPIE